ncbi:MAG: hypothetical protein A2Y74_02950 [Actinobacteria bacterium RBG_13_63_9]|nr:MAG: hypothetical protein A2Y74_02950 [Actinobacteria bacterium RBG_13_63_9]
MGQPASSTARLAGRGVLAGVFLSNPPAHPPAVGTERPLYGTVVLHSLDPVAAAFAWRLKAQAPGMSAPQLLGQGQGNVQNSLLGIWTGVDTRAEYELRIVVTDGLGRDLTARLTVPSLHLPRRHLSRVP